jgi:hypothetical protein
VRLRFAVRVAASELAGTGGVLDDLRELTTHLDRQLVLVAPLADRITDFPNLDHHTQLRGRGQEAGRLTKRAVHLDCSCLSPHCGEPMGYVYSLVTGHAGVLFGQQRDPRQGFGKVREWVNGDFFERTPGVTPVVENLSGLALRQAELLCDR